MKWLRLKAGHYVTDRPHDGLIIQRDGRAWSLHRYGRRVGTYTLLRIAMRTSLR